MIWKFFPRLVPVAKGPRSLDWAGSILLAWTVGAPLVGLELLTMDAKAVPTWFSSLVIVSAIPVGWLLMMVERRVATPMFPLRILETRQARLLNTAAILCGAIMFVLIYYIPLQFQDVFGFSPTRAGILISPLVAGIPIGSIINGRIFPRSTNPQRLMVFGSALLCAGCLMALTFSEDSSVTSVLVTMGICGVGLGFLLPNFTLFIQIIASREDLGVASALIQTTRAIGSAVGTALVGMVIAEMSIRTGLRIGLIAAVVASVCVGWLVSQVKMSSYTKG